MRVVCVNKYAHVTAGADVHYLAAGEALKEAGHRVVYLSTASEKNETNEGCFIHCSVTHRSRGTIRGVAGATVLGNALWNGDARKAMRRLIREFEPDIVHAHKLYPQISVAPLVEAARAGIPVVQTTQDYELIAGSAMDHIGRWRDRDEAELRYRVLNNATFPIRRWVHRAVVSQWVAVSRRVGELYRRAGIEATVIPNFVEAPSAAAVLPLSERRGAIYVGRLRPEKGIAHLLEAAVLNRDEKLTVVGDGILRSDVERAASDSENIEYCGFVPRETVGALIARARVMLVPSLWEEPGAHTPLEAMVVGTPVVAYDNGGLAEYVRDAGAGLIIRSEAEALASAWLKMVRSESEWEKMSSAGRVAVAERHSPQSYVRRIENVYREALTSRMCVG